MTGKGVDSKKEVLVSALEALDRAGQSLGSPFTYAPAAINSPPVTQTCIQQQPLAEAAVQPAPPENYWYYCAQPAGYFPYVRNCNQPWMKVIPQDTVNQK